MSFEHPSDRVEADSHEVPTPVPSKTVWAASSFAAVARGHESHRGAGDLES
jgi:hypothetical protein